MFVLIVFVVATIMFYLRSKFAQENEDVLTMITYTIGIGTALTALILFFEKEPFKTDLLFLAFVPFFAFGIYFVGKNTISKGFDVIANQQRYFNEVTAKDIYEFYKTRKSIKSNRVETLVNKDSKKLVKDNTIIPAFYLDLINFTPTKIKDLKEVESNRLYNAVFKKIKEFAKAREISFNYQKELEKNAFCVEFFLLDLYEQLTSPFNISVANLEVIAKNRNEIELLGALDLINLNCIKRKGAVLYYKYIEFKGRIEDFYKENSVLPNQEDEVFDEVYARENDSTQTIYKGEESK